MFRATELGGIFYDRIKFTTTAIISTHTHTHFDCVSFMCWLMFSTMTYHSYNNNIQDSSTLILLRTHFLKNQRMPYETLLACIQLNVSYYVCMCYVQKLLYILHSGGGCCVAKQHQIQTNHHRVYHRFHCMCVCVHAVPEICKAFKHTLNITISLEVSLRNMRRNQNVRKLNSNGKLHFNRFPSLYGDCGTSIGRKCHNYVDRYAVARWDNTQWDCSCPPVLRGFSFALHLC